MLPPQAAPPQRRQMPPTRHPADRFGFDAIAAQRNPRLARLLEVADDTLDGEQ